MNNFNLLLIDWNQMVDHFENADVSQRFADLQVLGNYDELSHAAMSFLDDHIESKSSIWDRVIDPFNPMVNVFWVWIEFGKTYSQLRDSLPNDMIAHYDAFYLPFISPWMHGEKNQMFQLPEKMKVLQAGGVSMAISPEHCKVLEPIAKIYTFSYMIHSISCNKKESFSLKRSMSWFHPIIDSQNADMNTIHASYTEFTELLRKVVIRAARLNKGILAICEI